MIERFRGGVNEEERSGHSLGRDSSGIDWRRCSFREEPWRLNDALLCPIFLPRSPNSHY